MKDPGPPYMDPFEMEGRGLAFFCGAFAWETYEYGAVEERGKVTGSHSTRMSFRDRPRRSRVPCSEECTILAGASAC